MGKIPHLNAQSNIAKVNKGTMMTLRTVFLASASALMLASCGGGGGDSSAPQSKASAAAAKVSSESPLEKTFSVKGAEELDVKRLFSLLPPGLEATYADTSFDKKTGATTVSGIKIFEVSQTSVAETYSESTEGYLEVGRAEFFGVDLELLEGINETEATVDAPFKTAFEKVRFFDLKFAGSDEDEAKFSMGAIEFDKLDIREGGMPAEKSDGAIAFFFNSFSMAGIYAKDIAFGAGQEGLALSFSAPDMRVIGLGGGKLDTFLAKDLEYNLQQDVDTLAALGGSASPAGTILDGPLGNFIAPEKQRAIVESVVWNSINLSGIMDYALKSEEPPVTATDLIDLGNISVLNTKTFIGERVFSFTPETTVSDMKFTWLAPSKIRSESKGGTYDFTAYTEGQEELTEALKELGLDKVKADSLLTYDWNAKKGGADFVTNFDADGLADVSMSFGAEGLVLKDLYDAMKAGDKDAVSTLGEFEGLSIEIADEKLLDAIFTLGGMQAGISAEDARQTAIGGLNIARLQAAQFGGRFNDYIDAIGAFLEEGGTLKIDASPEKPVPFSAFTSVVADGPAAATELVDLTISHKK